MFLIPCGVSLPGTLLCELCHSVEGLHCAPVHLSTLQPGTPQVCRECLCKCPFPAGGTCGQLFCCYKYLHSSPSFKEAHVGRTLTIGRHLVNGHLCDLEGNLYSVPCPEYFVYPCCVPGPPGPGTPWFWKGGGGTRPLGSSVQEPSCLSPAAHHCWHPGTARLGYATRNTRACGW